MFGLADLRIQERADRFPFVLCGWTPRWAGELRSDPHHLGSLERSRKGGRSGEHLCGDGQAWS